MPTGVVIGPLSATPFRRIDSSVSARERVAAGSVHHVGARRHDVPLELDPGRFEDAARRLGQLGPGAVSGDQGHTMGHVQRLYCIQRVPERGRSASVRDSLAYARDDSAPGSKA